MTASLLERGQRVRLVSVKGLRNASVIRMRGKVGVVVWHRLQPVDEVCVEFPSSSVYFYVRSDRLEVVA